MYHVYILASRSRTLYIGFTNDLRRRVSEHKAGMVPGFTNRYRIDRLVHFEAFGDVRDAKAREKQLKGWLRKRKIELIEAENPEWEDLADRIGLPASAITRAAG
ncbi:MAG TPA: GIY-YIG nuclease family protein [Longimicrobium sp.]|nr:GIY-YIG nuclease family protein [Longimicrobium sp.]